MATCMGTEEFSAGQVQGSSQEGQAQLHTVVQQVQMNCKATSRHRCGTHQRLSRAAGAHNEQGVVVAQFHCGGQALQQRAVHLLQVGHRQQHARGLGMCAQQGKQVLHNLPQSAHAYKQQQEHLAPAGAGAAAWLPPPRDRKSVV